ncbi:MAG: RNA-binding cell elongation regulator Jag/EloR [Dehalococcoidia bacterium]
MRDNIKISGKTVEDAIEIALIELDASRDEVSIDIISEGKSGLFGIGATEATVKVTRLGDASATSGTAITYLNEILSFLDVDALATIRTVNNSKNKGPVIDIQGEDAGLLIGKKGENLSALQFILNRILRSNSVDSFVTLDIEQYKERRSQSLNTLAAKVADRVMNNKRSITLEPMTASERRVIHTALADHPGVKTESFGSGYNRKVVVTLNKS